jgi:hypothetical protein
MNRKYQIFISSTFLDLKEERQAAVEAILLAGHIPAGMELFSAGDESQLDVIRRWIVDSDMFMLILGGRYGSIEPKSRKSYVELEYAHAMENHKPHFALVLSDSAIDDKVKILGGTAREQDHVVAYDDFRNVVRSKISRSVDDPKDVKLYTMEAIRHAEQRRQLIGWVRGNETVEVQPLLQRITDLTAESQGLKAQLQKLQALVPAEPQIENLADLGDIYQVRLKYWDYQSIRREPTVGFTWAQIFGALAPKLLEHPNDAAVKIYLTEQLMLLNRFEGTTSSLNEQDFQAIKIQLEVLGLIKTEYSQSVKAGMQLYWALTPAGHRKMLELRAIRAK